MSTLLGSAEEVDVPTTKCPPGPIIAAGTLGIRNEPPEPPAKSCLHAIKYPDTFTGLQDGL